MTSADMRTYLVCLQVNVAIMLVIGMSQGYKSPSI